MAPRITIQRRGEFSSIWLKYVRGVDLDQHCINTLIGERCRRISRHATEQEIVLDEFPIPLAYYLCGVTTPYVWDRNAHLAFVSAPGEFWAGKAGNSGLTVELVDAAPVFGWGEHSIPASDPHLRDRLYRTCRNWQFAHEMASRLGLKSQPNPDTRRYRSRRGPSGHPTLI